MTLELHSTDSGDVYAMTDPIACSSTPFRQRITCTHDRHSTTGKHSSWYAVLAFFVPHRALMYRRLVNQRSSRGHPVLHYLVRHGRTDEAALVTRNTTASTHTTRYLSTTVTAVQAPNLQSALQPSHLLVAVSTRTQS